jgi:Ca2+-binding EF-hand superfamily protein
MKKVVWSGLAVMACLAVAGTAVAADGVQKPRRRAQQRLEQRFKAMDKDGNGVISKDEWKGRPKAFDRLDANHDNVLSPQELRRGARKVAHPRKR